MITAYTGMTDETAGFRVPQNMTPQDLGDTLARLVWESFSDFIADGDAEVLLGDLGPHARGRHPRRGSSRGDSDLPHVGPHSGTPAWPSSAGRTESWSGKGLDAFHSAIFQDMVDNGTPQAQVPSFRADGSVPGTPSTIPLPERSDVELGKAVARHLAGSRQSPDSLATALTEKAIAVANPSRTSWRKWNWCTRDRRQVV